jgi:photosystem II stability/assembly factor-like uncharacterized protein
VNISTSVSGSFRVLALAIDPITPTTLYAGVFCSMYKSTNGGGSWSAINVGLSNLGFVACPNALAIDLITPTTLYAGTQDGGVFKSTNGGSNWVNTGLSSLGTVYALAIDLITPTTLYAGTQDGGVFKSTNGGSNWSTMNTGLPIDTSRTTAAITPIRALALAPTTLYAGTKGGVFTFTN